MSRYFYLLLVLFLAGCGGGGSSSSTPSTTANAGSDQFDVPEGTQVSLNGSSSFGAASYSWRQISGTTVTINSPNSAAPTFTAPGVDSPTQLEFELTVADGGGTTSSDTVKVVVADLILLEEFSAGAGNWTVVDDDNSGTRSPLWQVVNGAYQQQNRVESVASFNGSFHRGTHAYFQSGISWQNYRVSVDATYLATGFADDIGILFRYQNNNNYYRLSFNSRYGFARLEKKVAGTFSSLAVNARGYKQNQTLNTVISVNGDELLVFVNGDPIFAVTDSSLSSGTVALYTQDKAVFDNVVVTSATNAPTVVLASPLAHSVTGNSVLSMNAIVANAPSGSFVEFLLDGSGSTTVDTPPYSAFFSAIPTGNHTALAILRDVNGNEIARDTNVQVGTGGDYYLALGDSITNGESDFFAADNQANDGKIIAFQGFETNLHEKLNSNLGFPNLVFNEGIGGDSSSETSSRLSSILARHSGSNRVALLVGTNDSLSGVAAGQFQTNVESIVSTISAAGKQIWLARIPPIFGTGAIFADPAAAVQNTRVRDYNTRIAAVGGVSLGPDFYGYFLGGGQNRFSLFADTLHPNALGYEVMSALWHNSLNAGSPIAMPFVLDNVVPSTTTNANRNLKQTLVEVGDAYYVDNNSFTISSIPAFLFGGRWIMTSTLEVNNTGNNYISFSVDRPVTVYVAYSAGATLPGWLSGWTDTGEQIAVTNPASPQHRLYRNTFSAGSVVLGGNRQGGGNGSATYFAIVIPS